MIRGLLHARRPPSRLVVLIAFLVGLPAVMPAAAGAVGPNQRRDGRALFDADSTAADARRVIRPPADRRAAAAALRRALGPQAQVQFDRVTGTPREVAKLDGFLTGTSTKSPRAVVLDYLNAHQELFGLDAGDIAGLQLTRSYTDVIGTAHLSFAQVVDGVPTADNGIKAAVTRHGRLLTLQGSPLPDPGVATAPKLSATAAFDTARVDAGARGARPKTLRASTGPQRLTAFAGDNQAELVIVSTFGGPRLAWNVIADKSSTQLYAYVIDARTGKVLRRENTVHFATGLAWDYFPGPLPLNNSGVATSRDFTAKGWLASNATTLNGNNTHTYFDLLDDNTPAAGDEVPPSSGSNWSYSLTRFNDDSFFVNCSVNFPCSWDSSTANSWQTNQRQSATQLFYFVNQFHDYLKASPIGFTEAAGNFQVTNSSGQGAGGDAVQAQALNGANTASGLPDANHLNDTGMSTLGDGTPPRMQMPLMTGLGANGGDVNAGDDASVVYHEYTHGLSSRLVTDVDGNPALGAQQSGSMGEGWSDWYAMDYLVNHGYDTDNAEVGDVNVNYYAAGGPGARTQPLDCPVASTGDPCTNFNGAGDGGYTYADFGKVNGSPEVHADGEIWSQTLWELRQKLVAKYGATAGDQRVETYVTRGMELTSPDPSMIDARNGILQAETAATATGGPYAGSDDDDVLWDVFARRGLGYYAGALDGNDINPVADFSKPPAAGAPRGSLSGTVTQSDGGAPAGSVHIELGGHNGPLQATTGSNGKYTISNVPNGTYPYVYLSGPGYDTIAPSVTVSGATTRNFTIRRNWAQADGGGTVSGLTGPDLTGSGCGPTGAIDGTLAKGWGSTSPTSTQGPGGAKSLTIKLPRAITLSQFAVDPGATCGDDDNASLGGYKIETSPNGTTFTQANAGTFTASNDHKLNTLTPTAGKANVRYVRLTMNTPQSGNGSGKDWMDMSELKVYGVPVTGSGVRSDFNGDGYADLAVGVPSEATPAGAKAGLVNVIYGSSTGLTGNGAQGWTPDSTGVTGAGVANAQFGAAVAPGDFNGDGYADLAIGAPGDAVGTPRGGSVTILYGSATGLVGSGSVRFTQASADVPGNPTTGDLFGAALSATDVGKGSQDDLAVGVPGERNSAGTVHVLYGSAGGVTTSGNLLLEPAAGGSPAEAGDRFGAVLASGDVGKGATGDLVVGAPGESNGTITGGGAISVFSGATGGLSSSGKLITPNSAGLPGGNQPGDAFGSALAIADVTGSTTPDLAVGIPGRDVGGHQDAGEVLVLRGGAAGVVTSGGEVIDKSAAGFPGDPANSDQFGAALTGANVVGSTKADLVVGVPGQKVGTASQAGAMFVVPGATGGVSTSGASEWNQDRPSVPDVAEPSDRLGSTLSVGRWRGGSYSDFAAGVPSEDSSTLTDVGAVSTFVGASALSGSGSLLWTQNSSGVPDVSEAGDGFGGAVGLGG